MNEERIDFDQWVIEGYQVVRFYSPSRDRRVWQIVDPGGNVVGHGDDLEEVRAIIRRLG